MNYFGTNLSSAGHYFWELEGASFHISTMGHHNCPFNPEALPHCESGETIKNGTVKFYQFAGYSIIAIEGSPKDQRPASKSIFFVRSLIPKEELKRQILAIAVGAEIIAKMSFKVEW